MATGDDLIIYPVPALVAILLNAEESQGSPLTEEQVMVLAENCACITVPADVAQQMDDKRGYSDIDPEQAWAQWQVVRQQLTD